MTGTTTITWFDTILGASFPGPPDRPWPPDRSQGALANTRGTQPGQMALAQGCIFAGDGGGGLFYWDPAVAPTEDDGGTVICPSAQEPGGWRRVYSGALNVQWFGATGGRTQGQEVPQYWDDSVGIQNAIDAAVRLQGGTVYLPNGTWRIGYLGRRGRPGADPRYASWPAGVGLHVPPLQNYAVELVGQSKRSVRITADDDAITTLLLWGTPQPLTPDPNGSDHVTLYGRISGLALIGNAWGADRLTPSEATLLMIVLAQWLVVENVLVSGNNTLDNQGSRNIGIWLKGVTPQWDPGSHTYEWRPHVRRCQFYNVNVDNCQWPLILDNADENDFYSLECKTSNQQGAPADSVFAIDIQLGRNNRFFGTAVEGDPSNQGPYVGVHLHAPPVGHVMMNQFYGLVAEGFECGVKCERTNAGGPYGTMVTGYQSSINQRAFDNGGSIGNQTRIEEPLRGRFQYTGRLPISDIISVPFSPTITVEPVLGTRFQLQITSSQPFTLAKPGATVSAVYGPLAGQRLLIEVVHANSGGPIGPCTLEPEWVLSAGYGAANPQNLPLPQHNGYRLLYEFEYDGSRWRELWRSTAEQPWSYL